MPDLSEVEWNTVINNVCVISFLQGLSIGGKIYNGYSIVPNNTNEEYISEDSIYVSSNTEYYKITDSKLNTLTSGLSAYLSVDFESKYIMNSSNNKIYYYPQSQYGSYTSIVGHSGISDDNGDLYNYINSLTNTYLKKIYYTALARERYSMYRPNYDTYMGV